MNINAVKTHEVSLHKAGVTDIPAIAQFAYSIWNEYYVSIISQEQIDYMLNKMYSSEALEKQMNEGQNFFLIRLNHTPTGFVSVSEISPKEFMLHKFYVLGSERSKGLGSQVLGILVKHLNHPEKIILTVNRQNFKSINFYFKNGFTIEKVEDFEIGSGYYMNDFIMIWKNTINLS